MNESKVKSFEDLLDRWIKSPQELVVMPTATAHQGVLISYYTPIAVYSYTAASVACSISLTTEKTSSTTSRQINKVIEFAAAHSIYI